MGRVSLKLRKPVSLADEPATTELSFRDEITAGDLRGIKLKTLEDPALEDMLKIAGRLCGQPDALLNKLSLADSMEVVALVGGFMSAGLETGTTA